MTGEHWHKLGTKLIDIDSIKSVDRIIAPTKTRIDSMARSLSGPLGQLEPIIVSKYLNSAWKIVAGATRYAAAVQLGWKQIEATIIAADNDFEYQLIEITENLDRHDLSNSERANLKAKEDSICKQRLAFFDELMNHPIAGTEAQAAPAPHRATGNPPGRPKGGVRDAARKAGVPESTARDHVKNKEGVLRGSKKSAQNRPEQTEQIEQHGSPAGAIKAAKANNSQGTSKPETIKEAKKKSAKIISDLKKELATSHATNRQLAEKYCNAKILQVYDAKQAAANSNPVKEAKRLLDQMNDEQRNEAIAIVNNTTAKQLADDQAGIRPSKTILKFCEQPMEFSQTYHFQLTTWLLENKLNDRDKDAILTSIQTCADAMQQLAQTLRD
jgi:ParB-like chromosome segregation protein Spo0J